MKNTQAKEKRYTLLAIKFSEREKNIVGFEWERV